VEEIIKMTTWRISYQYYRVADLLLGKLDREPLTFKNVKKREEEERRKR
jgi:hypothetical protein